MNADDRRTLVASVACCCAPMLLGAALYPRLPDTMAVHFGIGDVPDSWAPKPIALFGIPLLIAALQAFACVASFRSMPHDRPRPRVFGLLFWLTPVLCCLVYLLMIGRALTGSTPIGKPACLVLGIAFIVMGNYMPKVPFSFARAINHPGPRDEASWRRESRRSAWLLIGCGAALLGMVPFV